MSTEKKPVIAISSAAFREFGCPYCGYRSGSMPVQGNGSAAWICGSKECGQTCCILADGATKSKLGFGGIYPELQPHPRHGIPSHGKPDIRPGSGGEFFISRGLGFDNGACLVCGTRDRDGSGRGCLNNIAAFVQCKDAGERVVAMFKQGARMDYREYTPDRVQVKICACDAHLENLEKLHELTKDGIITNARICEAMGGSVFDFDELQVEAERLVALLKEREPGLMSWGMVTHERMVSVYKLLSQVLNK